MFYSVSNHSVLSWTDKQILSAGGIDNIIDMGFPYLTGDDDELKIAGYVKDYLNKIPNDKDSTIFVAGEYCFTFALVNALKNRGQKVVYADADIKLEYAIDENNNSKRKIIFNFKDFKEYEIYTETVIKRDIFNPVFLNCSINYPIVVWDDDMLISAKRIGEPKDYLLSVFDGIDVKENVEKANKYLHQIDKIAPNGIILDGHFYTFYMMAEVLMRKGYNIYVKCGDRMTKEKKKEDGTNEKISIYKFKRFRKLFVL